VLVCGQQPGCLIRYLLWFCPSGGAACINGTPALDVHEKQRAKRAVQLQWLQFPG
jgi:hypothetical protein